MPEEPVEQTLILLPQNEYWTVYVYPDFGIDHTREVFGGTSIQFSTDPPSVLHNDLYFNDFDTERDTRAIYLFDLCDLKELLNDPQMDTTIMSATLNIFGYNIYWEEDSAGTAYEGTPPTFGWTAHAVSREFPLFSADAEACAYTEMVVPETETDAIASDIVSLQTLYDLVQPVIDSGTGDGAYMPFVLDHGPLTDNAPAGQIAYRGAWASYNVGAGAGLNIQYVDAAPYSLIFPEEMPYIELVYIQTPKPDADSDGTPDATDPDPNNPNIPDRPTPPERPDRPAREKRRGERIAQFRQEYPTPFEQPNPSKIEAMRRFVLRLKKNG